MADIKEDSELLIVYDNDNDNHDKPIKAESSEGGEKEAKFITSSGHHHHHHHSKEYRAKARKRYKKHKRKKLIKRVLIGTGIGLLSVAVIAAATFAVLYHSGKQEMKPQNIKISAPEQVEVRDNGSYVIYNNHKYRYNEAITNMLFLGIDKRINDSDEQNMIGNNGQSDVIALAAIDSKNNTVNIINIPRDIMTDVKVFSPGGGYTGLEKMQIALSFAYGDGAETSCINTMDAVRRLFYNIPVSSFFALNFNGIADVNDSIDGVDVKSPETISQFVKGEEYHLMGQDATDFVQKRNMEVKNANLLRNERQKVYLNSYINKFIAMTKKDIGVPVSVFNASAPYSCTNLNSNRITYLATEFILNRNMKIKTKTVPVTIEQNENHVENYVKEKEFYEMFLDIFYEEVK